MRFVNRIHKVHTVIRRNLLQDFCGPGERLTKIQTTTRPDHLWPENLIVAQKQEKQEWAIEKPMLSFTI